MRPPVLSRRALNRATLARQLLLERASMDPAAAIEHLVGLQAQNPLDPYAALWSRLDGFTPGPVGELLEARALVRIVVMRGTIHLVTADDALTLRPLVQPVLDAELTHHQEHKDHLAGLDLTAPLALARDLLGAHPRTMTQLRVALGEAFPDLDAPALAYACRNHLALVQIPPRGVWGKKLQVTCSTTEAWLGRSVDPDPSIDQVVLRYLRAFGPATVADVAAWSRLTAQGEVLDRLRPQLRTFQDEHGRELFDVPDGLLPDPETPAPARFLPEYDNALLGHADRSRFQPTDAHPAFGHTNRAIHGTALHDGAVVATWNLHREPKGGPATLSIDPGVALPERAVASLEAEGRRFLRFKTDDAPDLHVRTTPVP